MDNGVRRARLTELCEQIADCPHSTPLWTESGVVVLRNQNIRDGRLDLGSPSYTDEAHYEQRSRRARLRAGDLVLTREAPMGEVCMIPSGLRCCLGQRMVMLRADPAKCDPRFLLYSIQSDEVQHEIRVNEGTGSTVSNLRIPLLEALPIPHPSLREQKAIAAVLGALDDKIELNRRMNATLEAMARALFQTWFVDATENGLPNGWREGTIGEVAENPRRGIDPNAIKPETPYIALEHMPRRCIALSEWGTADGLESNKFEFNRGEILFGKLRPYFHKVGVAPIDGVCSTDILVIRPKEPPWFGFVLGHVSSVNLVNHTDVALKIRSKPRLSLRGLTS
jgi:type I restriction enzyme, S subunit